MSRIVILLIALSLHCTFAAPTINGNPSSTSNEALVLSGHNSLDSMISELFTKVLLDPLKHVLTMLALYLEIFSVASGTHFIPLIDVCKVKDREQQLIAIASTNLWLELSIVEQMNNVFIKATLSVIPMFLDNSSMEAIPNIVENMFQNIEKSIMTNASLGELYIAEKLKAEKLPLLPLANGTGDPDTVYKIHPRFRAFIVRRQFLDHVLEDNLNVGLNNTNNTKLQQHVLSRAVLELAKTARGEQVQNIFDDAVQTTVERFGTSKEENAGDIIDNILFSTLEEKFKKNPELNDELSVIKMSLFKNTRTITGDAV